MPATESLSSPIRRKEKRFRRDQAGWCRRILRARRTSYDANDATVAPFNGGKWTQL